MAKKNNEPVIIDSKKPFIKDLLSTLLSLVIMAGAVLVILNFVGNRVSVESHLLDYEGNLYGRQARVEFHAFLREEKRFADMAALSAQIRRDAETARAWFAAHPGA